GARLSRPREIVVDAPTGPATNFQQRRFVERQRIRVEFDGRPRAGRVADLPVRWRDAGLPVRGAGERHLFRDAGDIDQTVLRRGIEGQSDRPENIGRRVQIRLEYKTAVWGDDSRYVRGALRRRGGSATCLREGHSGRGAGGLRSLAGRPVAGRAYDGADDDASAAAQEGRTDIVMGRGRFRTGDDRLRSFEKFLALAGDVVPDRRVR